MFYRSFIVAIASLGLATLVFAADNANTQPEIDINSQQQVSVNQATDQVPATTDDTANTAEQGKVNINKATIKELLKVKGLNGSKARSIVSYRKKNGEFKSLDDLKNVKGFKRLKEENMKEIQDQLSLG